MFYACIEAYAVKSSIVLCYNIIKLTYLLAWFLGPTRVYVPVGMLSDSAVIAGLAAVNNTHIDRPPYIKTSIAVARN